MIRTLIGALILLGSLVIAAEAQNCRQYPPGHFRFQCKAAKHPELVEKKEGCRDDARAMGIYKAKKDPAFKEYVHACMQRH